MLQQGQVDAISTDDVVLTGLARQDPNVEVVGSSIAVEPYGIGDQEGEHRPGSLRQRGVGPDARRRHLATPLRRQSAQPRACARAADAAVSGLTMTEVSTEAIDRELDSRTKEVAAMSTTLIELEGHAGLEHVRRYPPIGVTAQRWAVVGEVIRAAVGRPGPDDVDPGLRAERCGDAGPTSTTTTAPSWRDCCSGAHWKSRGSESRWASAPSRAPRKPSSPLALPTSRSGCKPTIRRWPSSSTPSTRSTHWSPKGSRRRRTASTRRVRPGRRRSTNC